MREATRGLGRNALHLAVLSSFVIAQPLFDLLGKYPAFFAAHDSTRAEIIAFALVLVLVPPLVLVVIELLVGIVSPEARQIVHLVFVGLLAAVLALQVVRRAESLPAGVIFLIALALGAAAAVAYWRVNGVRSFLSILGPAPLVFLLLFLVASPSSKLVLNSSGKAWTAKSSFRPPIVFGVFDAFPGLFPQTPDGKIDAKRFPNLAKLQRDGAWYRKASNVHENTVFSVPSILDGNIPKKGQQPIVQDHPNNLFTLLGSTYAMNVAEEATNLCPPGLCSKTNQKSFRGRIKELASDVSVVYRYLTLPQSYREDLPQITDTWAGFKRSGAEMGVTKTRGAAYVLSRLRSGRVARFDKAVQRFEGDAIKPQLNFMHVFLPHEPRQYLADGREYQALSKPDSSTEGPPSYDKQFLAQQGMQRDLLQARFTDKLIGEMIDELQREGMYDRAMIVITADHGESFDVSPKPAPPFVPGKLGFRRAVTPENIEDIASVPLFVKYPKGHGPKGTDNRAVRTVDILPTIADVLGIDLPFKVSGSSLLASGYKGHPEVSVGRTFGSPVTISVPDWEARRKASLANKAKLFGAGNASLYRIGPRPDLLGKPLSALSVSDGGGVKASIAEAARFANVDPKAHFCPCYVAGTLSGTDPKGLDLAFALNGEIVATAQAFAPIGPNKLNWAVLLPPDKLRPGRNELVVLRADGATLRRLATTG
jgi:hypothetical protein